MLTGDESGGGEEKKRKRKRGGGLLKLSSSSVLLVPGLMYLKGAINADNMPTFSGGGDKRHARVNSGLHCFHSLIDKPASDGSASAHRRIGASASPRQPSARIGSRRRAAVALQGIQHAAA